MRIASLVASGGTGHQLAAQALDRGHSVLAHRSASNTAKTGETS